MSVRRACVQCFIDISHSVSTERNDCGHSGHRLASGENLRELYKIAEGIGEEGKLAADGRKNERFGHDRHAPRTQLRDGFLHTPDVQAIVVEACIAQAVAEIRVRSNLDGSGITPPRIST